MNEKSSNLICHCSILHKLDDSRIFYKECISLVNLGYNVKLIAKASTNSQFQQATYQGIKLQSLKSNSRLLNHIELLILVLKQRFNVVHFHDPELIIIGILFKLFGKKVIYDVHENVRQDMLHKMWLNPALRVLLSKASVLLENFADFFFNGIVATTPIIAKNFKNKNTYVIKNFPSLKIQEVKIKNKHDKNVVIYIGTLSEARGIKELIAMAEHLIGKGELWLLGKWNDNKFKATCEAMKGYKNTRYLGIVNHEDVVKILGEASIGICTLHPINTFKDSYPIKVFEYMQNGLPVLMSNFEMWQELFGELCEYVDPLNPKLIAEKIIFMLSNKKRLELMSENGKGAIYEKFNWNSEVKNLEELYNKI